jgi:hypothetical protein
MTQKPIVLITLQGGLVAQVNGTAPVTIFVEDRDCPPDRPLVMDFEAEPHTAAQKTPARSATSAASTG